jgi:large subunit ribosomal protein L25
MAETTKVVAKMRDRAGKGGARSSRRDGLIPAVIYGDKQPPLMIAVEPTSVEREMHKEGFFNHRSRSTSKERRSMPCRATCRSIR